MRFAVFTASLPELAPAEAIELLGELGFDGIEWRVVDQEHSPDGRPSFWRGNRCTWPLATFVEDAPTIRVMTERARLEMPCVGAYAECGDLPSVERALQGAALLGATKMRVNVPRYDGTTSYLKLYDRARAEYREVAELSRRYGVRALIELHHGRLLPTATAAAHFLAGFDPRDVGVIHDAGNMVHEGFEHYRLGVEALGPYLAHVHLKNAAWRPVGTRKDGSTGWRAEWAPLREGMVDVAALFRALRLVGYDEWITFEDFSTEWPVRERTRDNLRYAKVILARVDEERGVA
ncbi:MAG: sugar phosphate isomerase/epimerase [Chloroflexota bacterium]|nr:sugar phosphate isomerase/epimerase [Chloroflexota bacterium]